VKELRLEDKIKELIKNVELLEELMIRIISLVGWVIILIKILTP
jgi:hypothetical protein